MAVFRCGRFPHGEVPIRTARGLVVFTDGQAVVDDPELASALREQPASFEIKQVIDVAGGGNHGPATPTPDPTGRPSKAAPKADWVAWAVGHGMDADQADDLTKAQLIELGSQLAEE